MMRLKQTWLSKYDDDDGECTCNVDGVEDDDEVHLMKSKAKQWETYTMMHMMPTMAIMEPTSLGWQPSVACMPKTTVFGLTAVRRVP